MITATTKAPNTTRILQLQDFARANYEHGGHWIYECFDTADYHELLEYCNNNMDDAKAALQERWESIAERQRECSFGDEEH
jgi:hypothetical protein